MHLLESKARMTGVLEERTVGSTGAALNPFRQLREGRPEAFGRVGCHRFFELIGRVALARCSIRASSARSSSTSWDSLNDSSQSSSAAISVG